MEPSSLLQVKDLRAQFSTREGVIKAVNGVSFELHTGSVLGIVGESGCGKTVTALSILRLLPYPGKIVSGEVYFKTSDLLKMRPEELRRIRGKDIAMVFQDPMAGLNPVVPVGVQVEEIITSHLPVSKREARKQTLSALDEVGLPEPERMANQYAFQLSGGMAQRVMLAMAIALSPQVIIADEPTSSQDVTLQAEILQHLKSLKESSGTGIILITHNLGVVAQMADVVAVMYAGYIVEHTTAVELFKKPLHPYTWGLMKAVPRLDAPLKHLAPLRGSPPNLKDLPDQCPFIPRCNKASNTCRLNPMPPLVELEPHHYVACYNPVSHEWD